MNLNFLLNLAAGRYFTKGINASATQGIIMRWARLPLRNGPQGASIQASMDRRSTVSRGFALAKSGLAGLLVVLMLALSVGSVLHRNHADHQASQHSCAACLIAHGGLVADGATGTVIISCSHSIDLPNFGEAALASVFDLRLAPGRGPPV
jgi:hypothetical protein